MLVLEININRVYLRGLDMGINFSDSIARLRLQHASLNVQNMKKDNTKSDEVNIQNEKKEDILNSDSFQRTIPTTKNESFTENEVTVKHYKNAARAAAAVSQYGLNSGNAYILRKMTSFSDKNTT